MEMHKPHIALLASPGLGHLIPLLELGKRFATHHGFKVTILAVPSQTSEAETQILKSAMTAPELYEIVEIPSPDISSLVDADAAMVTRLCVMMRETCPFLRSALCDINHRHRLTALIVDTFGTEAFAIAEEFNIPKYLFVPSNAWFTALVLYSPTLDKLVKGQYVEQKEALKIPGCNPVRPEDVVDPMLDRNDQQYEEYLGIGKGFKKSDGILVNTWDDLQSKDLAALRAGKLMDPVSEVPVYGIGPLVRPVESTKNSRKELLDWLDEQLSQSVIYVSFGSGGTFSDEQTTEIALGLELSGQRFIWVVRPPTRKSSDAAFFSTGYGGGAGTLDFLPEGFLSRTKNVGQVVLDWAPQVAILSHPSVGGFLSHCGWNSSMESIINGVPMIIWPMYAEQRMNATLLAEELGLAVRPRVLPTKEVVGREEIASMVVEIMEVEKRNNPIKERLRKLKESGLKALSKGGSSYLALSQLAEQCKGHWRCQI